MTAIHKTTNIAASLNLALRYLREEATNSPSRIKQRGICSAISLHINDLILPFPDSTKVERLLFTLMGQWPAGTGNPSFPVPGNWWNRSPSDAFDTGVRWGRMWKGGYGKRRMALLNWLIQETQP